MKKLVIIAFLLIAVINGMTIARDFVDNANSIREERVEASK